MERYLLIPDEGASIDWKTLLSGHPDIETICLFPSGKAYIRSTPEALSDLLAGLEGVTVERIARRDR